ncbi:MAG: hypothetical protein CL670_16030 [Balneola sp.]|jgi:hypothetical protein|nr:hypothetical protein [Balneola sp.]MBE80618.1 hypothetical protein [Balneola sp.]MBE80670.1 hypothetical protein [Balneola sp.]|tara:strand:+ start:74 stop:682 length:609 start_codon:yes stop_codon:yes gene_type:complete
MCYKKNLPLKTILFGLILLIIPDLLHAQNGTFDTQFYAQKSFELQKKGMIFLGSWATLNILSGTSGYFLSENSSRYFHQMNAGWNLVNIGIAGFALYNISMTDVSALGYTQSISELQNLDKLLLLNAGLDVGYMATGAWLWERGLRKNSNRLEGYGKSLVLQGAFLFAFDLVLYMMHSPITGELLNLSENLTLTTNGFRIDF